MKSLSPGLLWCYRDARDGSIYFSLEMMSCAANECFRFP